MCRKPYFSQKCFQIQFQIHLYFFVHKNIFESPVLLALVCISLTVLVLILSAASEYHQLLFDIGMLTSYLNVLGISPLVKEKHNYHQLIASYGRSAYILGILLAFGKGMELLYLCLLGGTMF